MSGAGKITRAKVKNSMDVCYQTLEKMGERLIILEDRSDETFLKEIQRKKV